MYCSYLNRDILKQGGRVFIALFVHGIWLPVGGLPVSNPQDGRRDPVPRPATFRVNRPPLCALIDFLFGPASVGFAT